jgi:D-serine deaminase-like pyridoxal phosphate-dependent protein
VKRRRLLQSAASLAATGMSQVLWAPGSFAAQANAEVSGHNAYFAHLNNLLKTQGPGRPVMLIDTERMNHNIDVICDSVGTQKTYRVVVKSLPSVPLLKHVMRRGKTRSLMVFHQPFLNAVADAFPDSDVLMGKPMPVTAAHTFYKQLRATGFNPAVQVQWLIDSKERLLQYQNLARTLGVQMRLSLEIDVGLHRGGFASPEALGQAVDIVQADEALSVAGLMGYEPQLTGLQADLNHPAVRQVLALYRGHMARLQSVGLQPEKLTLNGAGSHTLKIYERDKTMNDLSAGSGVVMPTDFDTHHLRNNRPALFIATPILKRYPGNPLMPDPPLDMQRLYYIYGGYWKAQMVSPANVGPSIYESTNQSPVTTSADIDLQVDDYMFLRPTQSEFVMLQFGDLLAVTDNNITARWPVFHQTG